MELKFDKLSFDETINYANENEDMKAYVERYCKTRKISFEEACKHDIVQTVAWLYRKNGGKI